jgi:phosphate acetyltransferase
MSEEAALRHAADPLFFGALLVAAGEADGCVAGAVNTTGDVLRAAFWAIGPAPGIGTVSSSFYMVVPPFDGATEPAVLTFTDCGVVPEPTPAQLAEIAIAAADARRRVVGDEPRVAFLSYSTKGSAEGPLQERTREALALFRERSPEIAADGELQADAALIAAVGARKAPDSVVAGRANVLVFPDLNAGNISYKLVERLAHAHAVGPIVQGLARPCNDLSRGASSEDIVNVACITALMAGELTGEEAAAAKLCATDLEFACVDAGVQFHGGYGWMNEYPIARMFRDTRITRIFGGSNEIMKEIIGRSLKLEGADS